MPPTELATDHDLLIPPARIDDGSPMPTDGTVSRLEFLTVLRVRGGDAPGYLQGQLTTDVNQINPMTSRLGAWCSPKGRVLMVFRLLAEPTGDGYLIVCEHWFVEKMLARLRMFILRADVHIDDARHEFEVVGVAGTRAFPDRIATWAETADIDDATRCEEAAIVRVSGRHRRFVVVGSPTSVASIVAPHSDRAPTTDTGWWHLADIYAGVARITENSSGAFIPQMLNLDRLGAVSFEKGCYVGQEIIARAQHLGRIKRRTYLARATTVTVGDAIVETTDGTVSKVGEVLTVEPHPDGGSAAGVVLNTASASVPRLRVGRADGAPVQLSPPECLQSTD